MENYDSRISDEKKKATKAIYLFRLATEHMTYKNNRQEKNIIKLYFQIKATESYEEKLKIKNKLKNAFNGLPEQELVSPVKLEQIIRRDFKKKNLGSAPEESIMLSVQFAEDLKGTALKYLDEYLSCYWRIKLIEQEQMENQKAPQVQEKPIPEQPIATLVEQPKSKYNGSQSKEPTHKLYSSKYSPDAQQKEVNESLLKMLQENPNAYERGLSYDLKEEIREVYEGQFPFVFADIVSNAIEMNQISNEYAQMNKITKKLPSGINPRVNDLMGLALDCYKVTVYRMEHQFGYGTTEDSKKNSNELFRKLHVDNSLALYQQAYDMFMKYYASLSAEEKEAIKEHIIKYGYEYKKVFNIMDEAPRIVTQKDIVNAINKKMGSRVKEEFHHLNVENTTLAFDELLRTATQYMTVEEIVELYKEIKRDSKNNNSNEELSGQQREIAEKEQRRKMEILQSCFIEVIKRKIHFKVDYDTNMPLEEQNRAVRMMNVQSAMIANDFFNEELIFNPYNITKLEIQPGVAKKKSEFMDEAQKAEERFFGMSKLKQALAGASSYKKLTKLIEKQNVTDEDVAFAKRLY